MAAEIAAGERAVTAAVREAGTGLKLGWRGQITGAGLGRAARELDPVGGVPEGGRQSQRRGGGLVEGAGDHRRARRRAADPSRNGLWLAIPTPAAGKALGGRQITPAAWERRTGLGCGSSIAGPGRACSSRRGRSSGAATAPIFLLVPQVKLPKRLDLARDAERAHDAVPGLIVANWVEGRSRSTGR